jgi:acetylornithine aminotransferase/acetylornithine/N-succinyldiaminopimelate aminotransferase
VAFEGAFHGRTLGSLATTWAPKYRQAHLGVLPDTRFVPWGDHEALRAALAPGDVAAVIIEPIQSIAGMRALPAVCVPGLRALCDAHGTKLIFDEVQTGVGRTGTFSISEQLGATPDLITLAKSLGAGVPVSATLVSDALAATIDPGDHGSTFGGGMLAMAAVKATLDTLAADDLMARAPAIFDGVRAAVGDHVAEVRGRGALIGLRLERPVKPLIAALRAEGVLTGGSADPHVMRLMPPLVTSDDDLATFASAFRRALASLD